MKENVTLSSAEPATGWVGAATGRQQSPHRENSKRRTLKDSGSEVLNDDRNKFGEKEV